MQRPFFLITALLTYLVPSDLLAFEYVIQDLGTLTYQESHVTDINQKNAVVGYIKNGNEMNTFLWQPKKGLTLLPHLNYQSPLLNNQNQVVDIFWRTTNYWLANNTCSKHIYIYQNGSTQDLRLPKEWNIQELDQGQTPSIWDTKELGILAFNDQQQLLISNAKNLEKASRFAIWQGSRFQKIDPEILSNAYGMNNQGMILGRRWVKKENGNTPFLVIYNPSKGTIIEIMKDINIVHRKMNDHGQVIVFQALKDAPIRKGFFWDPNKGLIEIEGFFPMALNNRGQIVGFREAKTASENPMPAFWSEGSLVPLTHIKGFGEIDSLWSRLKNFTGINDNGYIIGEGQFDDKVHGFVLIPK